MGWARRKAAASVADESRTSEATPPKTSSSRREVDSVVEPQTPRLNNALVPHQRPEASIRRPQTPDDILEADATDPTPAFAVPLSPNDDSSSFYPEDEQQEVVLRHIRHTHLLELEQAATARRRAREAMEALERLQEAVTWLPTGSRRQRPITPQGPLPEPEFVINSRTSSGGPTRPTPQQPPARPQMKESLLGRGRPVRPRASGPPGMFNAMRGHNARRSRKLDPNPPARFPRIPTVEVGETTDRWGLNTRQDLHRHFTCVRRQSSSCSRKRQTWHPISRQASSAACAKRLSATEQFYDLAVRSCASLAGPSSEAARSTVAGPSGLDRRNLHNASQARGLKVCVDPWGRFLLPTDEDLIISCVHNHLPYLIPLPLDYNEREALEDSKREVQRFVFCILSWSGWEGWDGRPLIIAHPHEVRQFCLDFKPSAAALNTAQRVAELNAWDAAGGRFLGTTPTFRSLCEAMIWSHVCELRGLREEKEEAQECMQRIYTKIRPWNYEPLRWEHRSEAAEPVVVSEQPTWSDLQATEAPKNGVLDMIRCNRARLKALRKRVVTKLGRSGVQGDISGSWHPDVGPIANGGETAPAVTANALEDITIQASQSRWSLYAMSSRNWSRLSLPLLGRANRNTWHDER